MKINPEKHWVKEVVTIPQDDIEEIFARLYLSNTGNVAKSLRVAFGSLLIQQQYIFADEEQVDRIQENSYCHYLIGLLGYVDEIPVVHLMLVAF